MAGNAAAAAASAAVSGAGSPPPAGFVRRAAGVAGTALLVCWVLAALAVVVFSFAPRLTGREALIVRSGSMEPAIPLGSVVVVAPVPPETLRAGDVITFERADATVQVVTHRIVEVVDAGPPPTFRTKGDANNASDPVPVQYRTVGWKVVARVPYAGFFFAALAQPAARALLVGVPALLLAGSFVRDLWRGSR